MNKTEILAALTAAGIPCDETMTVAVLKELAAANGIPTTKPKLTAERDAELPQGDQELIAAKVAVGLTYEQAVEVINRQREEDQARA